MLSPLKYVQLQPLQLPLKMWVPHGWEGMFTNGYFFFSGVKILCDMYFPHAWIEFIDRIISEAYSYERSEKVIKHLFHIRTP